MLNLSLGLSIGCQPAAVVSGGATGTVWDGTSNADFAVSGGGLIASYASGSGDQQVRALASHAKALSATAQFTVTVTTKAGFTSIGLIDPTVALVAAQVGNNTKDLGYWSDGRIALQGGLATTVSAYNQGDVVICRIVAGKVGFSLNGTWQNSFDPATGANGVDLTATSISTVVPAAGAGTVGEVLTADFTGWS